MRCRCVRQMTQSYNLTVHVHIVNKIMSQSGVLCAVEEEFTRSVANSERNFEPKSGQGGSNEPEYNF